jgi:Flp pilus assembly pilin Flp
MSMLLNYVKSFAREEEGQDLLEYALLVALIALIAIGAVGAAGGCRVGTTGVTRGRRERVGPSFPEVRWTRWTGKSCATGGAHSCNRQLLLPR